MTRPIVDLAAPGTTPGDGWLRADRALEPGGTVAGAPDRAPIYDPVTGLPNRTLFLDRLSKAMASARRENLLTGVVVLSFGDGRRAGRTSDDHREGLKQVTARLLGNLRATDSVARLDERTFGVVQFGLKHADGCFTVCRRLQKLFGSSADSDQRALGRLSMGAAIADCDREPAEIWLERAETALRKGDAGTCKFADPVHEARWHDRLNGEQELRRALRDDQFELHYLPVVQPTSRQIVGLEALVRWHHPTRGLLPPAVFLPLAEECGQMDDIGRWILRRACTDAATWPSSLGQVMVNVSPGQFHRIDLAAEVADALEASGLAAERLVLEIREDVLLDQPDKAIPVLNTLRSRGVGVALDDFGTGRSSLNLLQWFAFDRIKIDQRLIAEISRHPAAATIARAIIAVGRAMGVRITAEGVDSPQKLASLIEEGCDEVQGFYLARPLPNAEVHRLVELIGAQQGRPTCPAADQGVVAEVQP